MAKSKGTHSRRKRKNAFPEIKGKIVEGVELMPTENGYAIGIMFQDRTYLSFDVEPYITIFPEFSAYDVARSRLAPGQGTTHQAKTQCQKTKQHKAGKLPTNASTRRPNRSPKCKPASGAPHTRKHSRQ